MYESCKLGEHSSCATALHNLGAAYKDHAQMEGATGMVRCAWGGAWGAAGAVVRKRQTGRTEISPTYPRRRRSCSSSTAPSSASKSRRSGAPVRLRASVAAGSRGGRPGTTCKRRKFPSGKNYDEKRDATLLGTTHIAHATVLRMRKIPKEVILAVEARSRATSGKGQSNRLVSESSDTGSLRARAKIAVPTPRRCWTWASRRCGRRTRLTLTAPTKQPSPPL
jgi:hypothetical protein